MTARLLVLGVLLLLMVSGCFTNYTITFENVDATAAPFTTIAQGTTSGLRERKLVVIRGEEEWRAYWGTHSAPITPRLPVPPVDFKTEMVVAVFAGEQPSGGQGVSIQTIETQPRRDVLVVVYRQDAVSPVAAESQALAQPFHIVKTKRIEAVPTFVRFAR